MPWHLMCGCLIPMAQVRPYLCIVHMLTIASHCIRHRASCRKLDLQSQAHCVGQRTEDSSHMNHIL